MTDKINNIAVILDELKTKFNSSIITLNELHGQTEITAIPSSIIALLSFLKTHPTCNFELLTDITAVDYLSYPEKRPARFAVIYQLYSFTVNYRIRIKVYLPESNPVIASATTLWQGAEWPEREVFDMFGISFNGHPDLRKILTPDDYDGYPLRKDYPLRGRGERENFPKYTRTEDRKE